MSARKHAVKVSLNSDELARLDRARGRTERAVYLRTLLYSTTVRDYKRALTGAVLRQIKFHGLRHSFGTLAVQAFPLSDVGTWMGHADIQTTMRYVHYVPQHDAAAKLGRLLDGNGVAPNLAPNAEDSESTKAETHA